MAYAIVNANLIVFSRSKNLALPHMLAPQKNIVYENLTWFSACCVITMDSTFPDENLHDESMFEGTKNNAVFKDANFAYGLSIIVGLLIIVVVFYSYNSFTKKKTSSNEACLPWQKAAEFQPDPSRAAYNEAKAR